VGRVAAAGGLAEARMTFDAHGLAQRSAERRKKLTLTDVEEQMPALDSPENIRLAAQRIQRWGAAGMLKGVVVSACIRACEVALRAIAEETDLRRVRGMEQRIKELEAELSQRRPAR